jgi:hypothetical protein
LIEREPDSLIEARAPVPEGLGQGQLVASATREDEGQIPAPARHGVG